MAVRLPPMQALRAFEATAREGSLTRAAESLNLTHGAISHQIKSLEADLGLRLTERHGRGIRLTDEGERFASRVRAAFAELTAGVREITAHTNPRLLRVSVGPLVCRPLALAAHRPLSRGLPRRRSRRTLQYGERRFRARRCRCRDPVRPWRLAGSDRGAPAGRCLLPGVQSPPGAGTPPEASRGTREVHAAARGR